MNPLVQHIVLKSCHSLYLHVNSSLLLSDIYVKFIDTYMNYLKARQMQSTGKWHYTCRNDNFVWPQGYCAQEGSACHSTGHNTAEEACECYKQYQLKNHL